MSGKTIKGVIAPKNLWHDIKRTQREPKIEQLIVTIQNHPMYGLVLIEKLVTHCSDESLGPSYIETALADTIRLLNGLYYGSNVAAPNKGNITITSRKSNHLRNLRRKSILGSMDESVYGPM